MKKRVLAVLLALCLAVTLLPVTALADGGRPAFAYWAAATGEKETSRSNGPVQMRVGGEANIWLFTAAEADGNEPDGTVIDLSGGAAPEFTGTEAVTVEVTSEPVYGYQVVITGVTATDGPESLTFAHNGQTYALNVIVGGGNQGGNQGNAPVQPGFFVRPVFTKENRIQWGWPRVQLPEENTVYYMTEDGFTEDTLTFAGQLFNGSGSRLKLPPVEKAYRNGSSGPFDYKITVVDQDIAYGVIALDGQDREVGQMAVTPPSDCRPYPGEDACGYMELLVSGDPNNGVADGYRIGFDSWSDQEPDWVTPMIEQGGRLRKVEAGSTDTGRDLFIGIWDEEEDHNGIRALKYDRAGWNSSEEWGPLPDGDEFTITVTRYRLLPVEGAQSQDIFSFDENSLVTVLNAPADGQFNIWAKNSGAGKAWLLADVTVTPKAGLLPSDEAVTATISYYLCQEVKPEDVTETVTVSTVAELNAKLADWAEGFTFDARETYTARLAAGTYDASAIVIPGGFQLQTYKYLILETAGNGEVVFTGGLDLNGAEPERLSGINFTGTAGQTGLFGGGVPFVTNCSFTGYDVAVDCAVRDGQGNPALGGNGGMIGCVNCVFENNTVAALVALPEYRNTTSNPWQNNTFRNNGTAVKMLSFTQNNACPDFRFRVMDSDFIGNTTDFDLNPTNGEDYTVYMYRNFYGADADTSRPTRIVKCDDCRVVTNPRRDKRVGDRSGKLVADWDQPTEIDNEAAGELTLDGSAFEEEGAKFIFVLEFSFMGSRFLGRWEFHDPAQQASLLGLETAEIFNTRPAAFNAGLTVEEFEDAIVVTVTDSQVLADHGPALTVPCYDIWESAGVMDEGGSVIPAQWDDRAKEVTFPVEAGGRYVITAGDNGGQQGTEEDPGTTTDTTPTAPSVPPTTTETKENEDGSTTTTVTDNRTGAVTETTTQADGTVKEVVTEKDGTVTETVKETDGTVTEVVTQTDGTVERTVTQPDGGAAATVITPEGDVAVTVTDADGEPAVKLEAPAQVEAGEARFDDIPADHWSKEPVERLAAMGLIEGTGDRAFSGSGPMDRGMMATLLHRLSGSIERGENTFTDVPTDAYYADGVAWAADVGLIEGVGGGRYESGRAITREELAVTLFRYAKLLGAELKPAEGTEKLSFADRADVSPWAAAAMDWAVSAGLINGMGGRLSPHAPANREQVATLLIRFLEKLKG